MNKKLMTIVALVLVGLCVFTGCSASAPAASAGSAAASQSQSAAASAAATSAQPSAAASASTAAADASLSNKKVAMVLWGTMYDFFVYIGAGAKEVAAKEGVKLDVLSTNDLAAGSDLVSQAITQKYDAIIVLGYEAYRTAYEEAITAKIPVITFDSFVDNVDLSARVGSNNADLGSTAGKFAVDYLKQKGDKVAGQILIMNVPSTETMNMRSKGFKDTVAAAFPNMKLTTVELNDNQATADESQKKVADLLVANPTGTVDMIFGSNAGMSLGALSAVEVAGRKEIAVVGIDNEQGQLDALKDGSIYKATVAQDPVKIGEESMNAAIKALKGEKAGDTAVPGILVTHDNVDDFLAKQKESYASLAQYKP